MTIEQIKIIQRFFEISRYHKMKARANHLGLGEMTSITESGDIFYTVKIKGMPELNMEQLTKNQLINLFVWMNTKITFINNLRNHYFIEELKNVKTIYLERCYKYVDVAVLSLDHNLPYKKAMLQTKLLKNIIRSVGFGVGQKLNEIVLIHYKPEYYELNRWKRYWCDLELSMQWDANKPYKWSR